MYFMLSWDISGEGAVWREQNKKLKGCLDGFIWAKPIYTFYLVKVSKIAHREIIRDRIKKVKEASPVSIYWITSPVFKSSGNWAGYLASMDLWDETNAVVEGDR